MKITRKMKKLLALCLAIVMSFSLVACSGNGGDTGGDTDTTGTTPATGTEGEDQGPGFGEQVTVAQGAATQDGRLDFGGWYEPIIYFSNQTSEWDKESYDGGEKGLYLFQSAQEAQAKYGWPIYYNNLTYAGVKESVMTSIIAGTPDMDIYMMGFQEAVPAAFNGLFLDLKTVLPADHDIFTDQTVAYYVDLLDNKATLFWPVDEEEIYANTWLLGYNLQLLLDAGLERPEDLYARGEWTWDKFMEYLQIMTKDTDSDGQIDQWGFCGYMEEVFGELVMSNGAVVAGGATETMSSAEVGEVLQFIADMGANNVAFKDFEGMGDESVLRRMYRNGNIAFWPIARWVHEDDYNINSDSALGFDTVYVRWPVGPHGDAATNCGKRISGSFYALPVNVAEPVQVFNYWYDTYNWYKGDVELRQSLMSTWWYEGNAFETPINPGEGDLRQRNLDAMYDAGSNVSFDLWNAMGVWFLEELGDVLRGTMTPAQLQETYKNEIQAGLDVFFK
jgi:ABC-type glycerol-3-phosphate transport system substrate-binding protein